MYNKIAFVCANPWEKFLPAISRGNAKDYYDWLCQKAFLKRMEPYCEERIELYGDFMEENSRKRLGFRENSNALQFLYLQGKQSQNFRNILKAADFVVVGMPDDRKECDEIYLSVLPWKEKSVFLWDGCRSKGEAFFKRLQREYQIKDTQIAEIKMLPSF